MRSNGSVFSITITNGQLALNDHGGREITRVPQSLENLDVLIKQGEERGEVTISGAVLRFALVYLMPLGADAYMQAIHASWPIKRFPVESLSAIRALVATGDMPCVVNYIKFAREANRL
jgi:hypothetical protein